jgi:hypothetical protein
LVERFAIWKAGGGGDLMGRESTEAEAFVILEKEWRETANGESV